MNYHLETLGDERFQEMCQALLAVIHPNLQCLPVGQPDGGRDAFLPLLEEQKGFIAYQVKYTKDPKSQTERETIKKLIKTEKAKIKRLKERGASSYVFMTNVAGTAHLDVGSIDKVNEELTNSFGLPTYCWWRDDIERRIDIHASIKWSYPEILKATDLLQHLLAPTKDPEEMRRSDVISRYMAIQLKQDARLKFKQIELQKDIIDLFVDVPARLERPSGLSSSAKRRWHGEFESNDPSVEDLFYEVHEDDHDELELVDAYGTLQLLSREDVAKRFPAIVVEGAPGQGKSTVTQYLCQINRLTLLHRTQDLARVDEQHSIKSARIPFRVDLRDYATWVSGRDPFSDDPSAKIPTTSSRVLESFLAFQVHHHTGSSFTVDDLVAVSKVSSLLIVLDGFDEVADISLRNKIVAEVSNASTRINETALSAQIIVTSRPAAFANSPGFPRDEWQHVQILPLTKNIMELYALKWIEGRGADQREKKAILNVLAEKLDQPHIRDLARNPMQLAILLSLISVKGESLPDKRTALYDEYVEIFLNREAEKSRVVLEHRELLVQIHRYLAWVLQGEAETSGSGHITEKRLRELLRDFLETAGHSPKLVDQLFTGVVERVVALVSRVQGTFEFEVQPLREYFAARYLYETAQYSPPGKQCSGTLPDRFDAIARNFYWLNVTRFYAGCYNAGELSSLIDGIDDLCSSSQFQHLSHGTQLGITLLTDLVFGQYPKLAARLAANLERGAGFHLLLANRVGDRSGSSIRLPSSSAQDIIIAKCKVIFEESAQWDVIAAAARVLTSNLTLKERNEYWFGIETKMENRDRWLSLGHYLSVYDRITVQQARQLASKSPAKVADYLFFSDRLSVLDRTPGLWNSLIEDLLDSGVSQLGGMQSQKSKTPHEGLLANFSLLLAPIRSLHQDHDLIGVTLRDLLDQHMPFASDDGKSRKVDEYKDRHIVEANAEVGRLLECQALDLQNDIQPWAHVIELVRSSWGARWALYKMAMSAAELARPSETINVELADGTASLCDQAIAAKQNAKNVDWWRRQMAAIGPDNQELCMFVLAAIHRWVSFKTKLNLIDEIGRTLAKLKALHWHSFSAELTRVTPHRSRGNAGTFDGISQTKLPAKMTKRSACFLIAKLSDTDRYQICRRYLHGYRGKDGYVHRIAAGVVANNALLHSGDWNEALTTIAVAYKQSIVAPVSLTRRDHSPLPSNIANKVCAASHRYPFWLVRRAESALAIEVGAAAMPVIKVAKRDEWFEAD